MAEEDELHELLEVDLVGQLLPFLLEGLVLAGDQLGGPTGPGLALVVVFQGHEQGVVVEPGGTLGAELGHGFLQLLFGLCETLVRLAEQGHLEVDDLPELDVLAVELGRSGEVLGHEQAFFFEGGQVDEQRVSGGRREALVGRVAVAGGAQGQDLPDLLVGLEQEIDETEGLTAQGADAVGPWQGCRVEEDSTATQVFHWN